MGAVLTRQELIYLKNRLNARSAKFSKNETVLHIGESENQLCFLLEGTVYLCTENERYERSILRFFRSGEYFSSAMLMPAEYAVSYMTAKYPSEVVFFGREELFRFCAANPDWQAKFTELLAKQGSRNACFTDFVLHQRSIREKLMFFFQAGGSDSGFGQDKAASPLHRSCGISRLRPLGNDERAVKNERRGDNFREKQGYFFGYVCVLCT